MKYIDNLLDWGDQLFAQDTWESITEATMLYFLAYDILGKKPEIMGTFNQIETTSFGNIRDHYKIPIPQFLIDLENDHDMNLTCPAFNDIHAYFGVSENEQFTAYWERVEDRLFKIRHCLNIKGLARQLALYEPPIDPAQLVRAMSSAGGSLPLSSLVEVGIPHYRFAVLIEKAKSITSQLMQLGGSLLAALEKKDAETIAQLRSSQEKSLLNLMTFTKDQHIKELEQIAFSLQQSQLSADHRHGHYAKLASDGLSPKEIENIVAMSISLGFSILSGGIKAASAISYALPQVDSAGIVTYGGQQLGSTLSSIAEITELGALASNFAAQLSLTMAGYERRKEEWQLQANLAGFDQEQIKCQIEAHKISQKIAQRELEIHQTSIMQNEEMEAFVRDKFTNLELYQWMVGQLSTVYFQTFNLALDVAKAAQRAYQFELDSDKTFVNFGYWDSLRKGLLAGEGLMLALNQMEKAYLDENTRTLEIEKTISLLQLDPKALLDLKSTGECIFALSELLFDRDYPGHYARKIKSISLSIPAVVGPYQNIKAILTQQSSNIVVKADLDTVKFLLPVPVKDGETKPSEPGTDKLRSNWFVNQQVAISKGVDDSGLFVLNFNDERYLPFEGTGAVSSWKLSMPKASNQFDFNNISDVIIQLKYTAMDGGDIFKKSVTDLDVVKKYSGSHIILMSQAFPQQWNAFLNDRSSANSQTLEFELNNVVPPHIKEAKLTNYYFKLNAVGDDKQEIALGQTESYIQLELPKNQIIKVKNGSNEAIPGESNNIVEGKGIITFDLTKTPDALKSKIGDSATARLNTEIIKDLVLILFYEGNVTW